MHIRLLTWLREHTEFVLIVCGHYCPDAKISASRERLSVLGSLPCHLLGVCPGQVTVLFCTCFLLCAHFIGLRVGSVHAGTPLAQAWRLLSSVNSCVAECPRTQPLELGCLPVNASPVTFFVTSDKLFNFSRPQFCCL